MHHLVSSVFLGKRVANAPQIATHPYKFIHASKMLITPAPLHPTQAQYAIAICKFSPQAKIYYLTSGVSRNW